MTRKVGYGKVKGLQKGEIARELYGKDVVQMK